MDRSRSDKPVLTLNSNSTRIPPEPPLGEPIQPSPVASARGPLNWEKDADQREVAEDTRIEPYPPMSSISGGAGKRYPRANLPPGQGFLTGTAAFAPGHRMPAPESPQTQPGRFVRPGADRFHTARSPASPCGEILPTPSPLTTHVEIPFLRSYPELSCCPAARLRT
jgi:hypothetical protein